eukprot:s4536_g5.t1
MHLHEFRDVDARRRQGMELLLVARFLQEQVRYCSRHSPSVYSPNFSASTAAECAGAIDGTWSWSPRAGLNIEHLAPAARFPSPLLMTPREQPRAWLL